MAKKSSRDSVGSLIHFVNRIKPQKRRCCSTPDRDPQIQTPRAGGTVEFLKIEVMINWQGCFAFNPIPTVLRARTWSARHSWRCIYSSHSGSFTTVASETGRLYHTTLNQWTCVWQPWLTVGGAPWTAKLELCRCQWRQSRSYMFIKARISEHLKLLTLAEVPAAKITNLHGHTFIYCNYDILVPLT